MVTEIQDLINIADPFCCLLLSSLKSIPHIQMT